LPLTATSRRRRLFIAFIFAATTLMLADAIFRFIFQRRWRDILRRCQPPKVHIIPR